MKKLILTLPVLAIAAATPSWGQLATLKVLSRDMVLTLVDTAVKCAQSDKITVAVVDRNQALLAQFRGPAGTLNAMEVARRKAATAAQFGQPTSALATQLESNPGRAATMASAGDLILGGALPIKLGDEVIGAIGVSGAGPVEEKCATEALAAIQSQLK